MGRVRRRRRRRRQGRRGDGPTDRRDLTRPGGGGGAGPTRAASRGRRGRRPRRRRRRSRRVRLPRPTRARGCRRLATAGRTGCGEASTDVTTHARGGGQSARPVVPRRPVAPVAVRADGRDGPAHSLLRGTGRRRAGHVGRGAGPRSLPRRAARSVRSGWWRRRPSAPVHGGEHRSGGAHLSRRPDRQGAGGGADGHPAGVSRGLVRHAAGDAAQATRRQRRAGRRIGRGGRRAGPGGVGDLLRRGARAPPPRCPGDGIAGADPSHARRDPDDAPHRERTPGGSAEQEGSRGEVADEPGRVLPVSGTRATEPGADRGTERRCRR